MAKVLAFPRRNEKKRSIFYRWKPKSKKVLKREHSETRPEKPQKDEEE